MEKLRIKNRENQNIVVLVDKPENPKGLAFVMHGLGGYKEQPQIIAFAEAFRDKDLTVVRFDTTNTYGESDGDYADATTTNYLADLEDVIKWAGVQPWYQEPFYLAGHSLGSFCIVLYAEEHPNKVKGLAPISTVVSGKLSLETPKYKETLKDWERSGWREEKSESVPGLVKKLKWSHNLDRLKYDVLPEARKLIMPIILVAGDKDASTPIEHQKVLFEVIPSNKKEFHVIKGAPHTFLEPKQISEVKNHLLKWIDIT